MQTWWEDGREDSIGVGREQAANLVELWGAWRVDGGESEISLYLVIKWRDMVK